MGGPLGGCSRQEVMEMKALATFRGYTVDRRLCEFRKLEDGHTMEFVPFESAKGQRLLRAMCRARQRR